MIKIMYKKEISDKSDDLISSEFNLRFNKCPKMDILFLFFKNNKY